MIDPQQVAEAFVKKTKTAPWPLPPPTSTSVAPIPTVVPDVPTFEKIGDAGTKTLWVIFAIMLISSLILITQTWRTPIQKRLIPLLTTLAVIISTLSYYAQATHSGISFSHHVLISRHKHGIPSTHTHVFRAVPVTRHLDWLLSTPLLLLTLAFVAGLDGSNIVVTIFANFVAVGATWGFAFANHEPERWGWFAMAAIAYLVVLHQLVVPARLAVAKKEKRVREVFGAVAGFEALIWAGYLVVTAIGDGGREASVDAEIIALGVVDFLAKPVFAFWLIAVYNKKYAPLIEGFWSHGLDSEGTVRLDDERA